MATVAGTDYWQPVIIGKSARPRCFGNHWKPESMGAPYYNNTKAWMRQDIWWDINKRFNR